MLVGRMQRSYGAKTKAFELSDSDPVYPQQFCASSVLDAMSFAYRYIWSRIPVLLPD